LGAGLKHIALTEGSLRGQFHSVLVSGGYGVEEHRRGEDLLAAVRRRRFDVVLMDVRHCSARGILENCRVMREFAPDSAVIAIGAPQEKITSLEAGADEYVTLPFDAREFLARLRSVMRRIELSTPHHRLVQVDDMELDMERHSFRQGEKSIHLTSREFELLAVLMQKPRMTHTHVQLLRAVWGPDYGEELEYLRIYIRMLRRKIEADPANPRWILTEPGIGYRFGQ